MADWLQRQIKERSLWFDSWRAKITNIKKISKRTQGHAEL